MGDIRAFHSESGGSVNDTGSMVGGSKDSPDRRDNVNCLAIQILSANMIPTLGECRRLISISVCEASPRGIHAKIRSGGAMSSKLTERMFVNRVSAIRQIRRELNNTISAGLNVSCGIACSFPRRGVYTAECLYAERKRPTSRQTIQ